MRSFARSGIRLVIPMVASAVVVVLLWIEFLKVFAINPMVGNHRQRSGIICSPPNRPRPTAPPCWAT